MFSARHLKHEYNFHDDETQHDQTPEVGGILDSLKYVPGIIDSVAANGLNVSHSKLPSRQ